MVLISIHQDTHSSLVWHTMSPMMQLIKWCYVFSGCWCVVVICRHIYKYNADSTTSSRIRGAVHLHVFSGWSKSKCHRKLSGIVFVWTVSRPTANNLHKILNMIFLIIMRRYLVYFSCNLLSDICSMKIDSQYVTSHHNKLLVTSKEHFAQRWQLTICWRLQIVYM